jgi:hypothetical protein
MKNEILFFNRKYAKITLRNAKTRKAFFAVL